MLRASFNGSFWTLHARNAAGAAWIAKNLVVESWQRVNDGVAVDHRYIDGIISGARTDGVKVVVR